MPDKITLNLTKVRESAKAILFANDTGKEAWIAKSQMHNLRDVPSRADRFTFEIEEWKIKDKGIL